MEKRTPHCRLSVVKALAASGRLRATFSALQGAQALGLEFDAVRDVVLALEPGDFRKSMTTHADHRLWQDVYAPRLGVVRVYLKLMVVDDLLVVSFKEA